MKFVKYFFIAILSLIATNTFADTNSLQQQRIAVIKEYVTQLGEGKYQTIPQLFTKDGTVVSSTGAVDNSSHFYENLFTTIISKPHSELINILSGAIDPNLLAGYFNFDWVNEKGKNASAKFLDLFIFEKDTDKIKTLYIYSNTFKEEIMKQLGK